MSKYLKVVIILLGVVHLLRYAKKRNFRPPSLVTNFPRKFFLFVWPVTKSQKPPPP